MPPLLPPAHPPGRLQAPPFPISTTLPPAASPRPLPIAPHCCPDLALFLVQVSTTDSEVTQAANFAAEQLSSQSNSLSPFEVKEVLSARSKVAAGKVFELKLKLSQGNLPEQIMQARKRNEEEKGSLSLQLTYTGHSDSLHLCLKI